jgi:3D (Asp-Asp-Asp) domain-containing protein
MILRGCATKGAISFVLVSSMFTVACAEGNTVQGKKEHQALDRLALEGTPKPMVENQSLLFRKEPENENESAIMEKKILIMERQKFSKQNSAVVKKPDAIFSKRLSKKRTAENDTGCIKKTSIANPDDHAASKENSAYSFVANISAYTASADEGTAGGRTASGRIAREGRTLAASRHLPLGTKVRIDGVPGMYVVEDRGGAINGNNIDLFVGSKSEAEKWGRQNRRVYITEWGSGKVD